MAARPGKCQCGELVVLYYRERGGKFIYEGMCEGGHTIRRFAKAPTAAMPDLDADGVHVVAPAPRKSRTKAHSPTDSNSHLQQQPYLQQPPHSQIVPPKGRTKAAKARTNTVRVSDAANDDGDDVQPIDEQSDDFYDDMPPPKRSKPATAAKTKTTKRRTAALDPVGVADFL